MFTRLVPGVIVTAPGPVQRSDWLRAGVVLAGPACAISGWDALRAFGLGDKQGPPSPDVLVLAPGGKHRRAGPVRIRPTRRPYRTSMPDTRMIAPGLRDLPWVAVARAVADASLEYRHPAPVRALVTSAVQRGLCTPAELVAELSAAPRNYSGLLRTALEDTLDGARSISEAQALRHLRRARIPAFEMNVPILRPDGTVLAVADVLWRELRAIAEIDSREFHFAEVDWKRTIRRHNTLTALGFAVAHFTPAEIVSRRELWADDVASWLQARGRELGVAYTVDARALRPSGTAPEPVLISALPP